MPASRRTKPTSRRPKTGAVSSRRIVERLNREAGLAEVLRVLLHIAQLDGSVRLPDLDEVGGKAGLLRDAHPEQGLAETHEVHPEVCRRERVGVKFRDRVGAALWLPRILIRRQAGDDLVEPVEGLAQLQPKQSRVLHRRTSCRIANTSTV